MNFPINAYFIPPKDGSSYRFGISMGWNASERSDCWINFLTKFVLNPQRHCLCGFFMFTFTLMMLRKVGLILLMQMSSLCVFAQTSLDTTTMLNSVTVTYNENPAIVIIKEASKTYKEYSKHHPKNLRIYSSRSRSPKGLRFEQVSNVFLESGRPYQEIEAFKDYKENRVNFGNTMEVKANAEVNFNSDFDFSDTEDKGGFEEYPLTNYSNFEWTPLSDVNRSLLSADRILDYYLKDPYIGMILN